MYSFDNKKLKRSFLVHDNDRNDKHRSLRQKTCPSQPLDIPMEDIYKNVIEYQIDNPSQNTDIHTPRGVLKASENAMYGKGQ